MDQKPLIQGAIVGVLLMMVIRSVVWLIHPEGEATTARYALNVANIAICGLTAWATWRPSQGAKLILERVGAAFRPKR
jgi:hypothetical protein